VCILQPIRREHSRYLSGPGGSQSSHCKVFFYDENEFLNISIQVLVIVSDDKCEYDRRFKMQVDSTVVVGIGENHYLKAMQALAGNDENALLCLDEIYKEDTQEQLIKGTSHCSV